MSQSTASPAASQVMPSSPSREEAGGAPEAKQPKPMNSYYFSDSESAQFATFLVEDRLFKVHRYILERDSPVFRDMFSLPQSCPLPNKQSTTTLEGTTDLTPIVLPQVTAFEFETLLDSFYKTSMHIAAPTWDKDRWVALLSVTHRYSIAIDYSHVMAAIERIPGMGSFQVIVLAERFDVPMKYIGPSLLSIIQRTNPLTGKEIESISSDVVAKIARFRELYRYHRGCGTRIVKGATGLAPEVIETMNQLFKTTIPVPP